MLQNLPDEILLEIINYCEPKDYLNFTLVCKKFNNVISNNSQLMKHIGINVSSKCDDSDSWNGTRKYSRIIIQKMHKELPKILYIMRNDLTSIYFPRLAVIEAVKIKNILLDCPKLLELDMGSLNLNFDGDECIKEPLPRLELERLSIMCNRNIFKMLMHCQTKFLLIMRGNSNPEEIEVFKKFLKAQKKLEEIEFPRFCYEAGIFNDETLNEVEFRLKSLKMFTFRNEFDAENFTKFLKNHQYSLQYLEVMHLTGYTTHPQIFNCLVSFSNLKSLKIEKFLLPTIPMPYVEKLEIRSVFYNNTSINWSSLFPNVKKLSISNCERPEEIQNFKKLETLSIMEYTDLIRLDEIPIPNTVKNLYVHEIWAKNIYPFNFTGHQIENFVIEETQDTDWVGDFLRSLNDKKLKFLKIDHCFLSRYRRFARLFEKEPELMNKAERFVFIDWKDQYDEDSESSEEGEVEQVADFDDPFASFYHYDPQDEIDWEYLAYEQRRAECSDEEDDLDVDDDENDEEAGGSKRSKLE